MLQIHHSLDLIVSGKRFTDREINERKHGQPVRHSDINETTFRLPNHMEKDGLLHQCHLCNKTVKSATGLKLHIRACLKKVNFQETNLEVKSLKKKNETDSLHQNNCSLKSTNKLDATTLQLKAETLQTSHLEVTPTFFDYQVNIAYEEIVKWRRNVFNIPKVPLGKILLEK